MSRRKRENDDDDDVKMAARDNQSQAVLTLDPALCLLLPRSVVEKRLMPFITHVFTSKKKLIQAVDEYVADPSTFCYRIGLWDVSQITDYRFLQRIHAPEESSVEKL